MKIGFIGGGNMAEAIIKGMTARGSKDIFVSEPREERRKYLQQNYGVNTTSSNTEAASACSIIILAVKPQNMDAVLNEIKESVTAEKTIVSIAAGITLSYLTAHVRTPNIVRVMPNTPALIQEGVSVMSTCGDCVPDKDIRMVKDIFMSVGNLLVMPEKYMDAVTALSGSGPAFIAFFIEAIVEGGIKMGLNKDDALSLAVQTGLGALKLLDTGTSPSSLREMVTSPGGTTAAGLEVFDKNGFKNTVIAAIEAAANRAKELGKEKD